MGWLGSTGWFSFGISLQLDGSRGCGLLKAHLGWMSKMAAHMADSWLGTQLELVQQSTLALSKCLELLIAWCLGYEREGSKSKHSKNPRQWLQDFLGPRCGSSRMSFLPYPWSNHAARPSQIQGKGKSTPYLSMEGALNNLQPFKICHREKSG